LGTFFRRGLPNVGLSFHLEASLGCPNWGTGGNVPLTPSPVTPPLILQAKNPSLALLKAPRVSTNRCFGLLSSLLPSSRWSRSSPARCFFRPTSAAPTVRSFVGGCAPGGTFPKLVSFPPLRQPILWNRSVALSPPFILIPSPRTRDVQAVPPTTAPPLLSSFWFPNATFICVGQSLLAAQNPVSWSPAPKFVSPWFGGENSPRQALLPSPTTPFFSLSGLRCVCSVAST